MDQVSDFLSNCSTLRVQNIMQSNINCNYIKEIKEPSYATSSYRLPEKVSMNYQGQNSPVLVKQEFPCKDIVKKIKSEDEIFYLVRSCMTTPKPAESQQFVTQYALMNTNEPNRSHLPVINNVVNFAECHQALQQDIRSNEQVQRQLYPINELYIPSVRDVPEKQFYLHEISPGLLQELNLHQRQQIVENQLIISQVQPESPQGSRDMLLVDELKRAEVQIVQNGICSKTSLPKSVKIHNSGIEEQSVCDPFSVYSANSVQLPLLNKANETTSNEISSGIEKHISSEHEVIDLYSPEEEVLSVNDSDSDVEVIHDNTNDWVDNITSVDHVLSEGAEDINTPMYQNNLKATVMLPDVLLERVEIATKSEREKRVIRKTRKVPVETNQLENVLVPTQIKRPRRRPRKVIDENEKTGQQEIVKKTKEHKRQLRNKTDENDKNGQVSKTEESKRVLRNKRKASDDVAVDGTTKKRDKDFCSSVETVITDEALIDKEAYEVLEYPQNRLSNIRSEEDVVLNNVSLTYNDAESRFESDISRNSKQTSYESSDAELIHSSDCSDMETVYEGDSESGSESGSESDSESSGQNKLRNRVYKVRKPYLIGKRNDESYSDDDCYIMLGRKFQAMIPKRLPKYCDKFSYDKSDKLLWNPNIIPEQDVEDYLAKALSILSNNSSKENLALPENKYEEEALHLLLHCGYSIEEALQRIKINKPFAVDTLSLWTEEECSNFESGLKNFGKDFRLIQLNNVRTKSTAELVHFYYLWKKTEQYDTFVNNNIQDMC